MTPYRLKSNKSRTSNYHMHTKPVNWPCIIKHANDPELTYLDNEQELACLEPDESDILIDATGSVYTPEKTEWVAGTTSETMDLTQVLGLVKAHAAQSGSCCVAKLYAPTISDAFTIVKETSDL
jgi:hypothetical protein